MYGSYGMYSGNKSNFSSASNLYKPAGVASFKSNYGPTNNGEMTSLPTQGTTSVISGVVMETTSFEKLTNTFRAAQHIDYQQNPSPIILSVRQHAKDGVYTDINADQNGNIISFPVGVYVQQYNFPGYADLYIPPISNPGTGAAPIAIRPTPVVVYEQKIYTKR
jgi:hypothetical protein